MKLYKAFWVSIASLGIFLWAQKTREKKTMSMCVAHHFDVNKERTIRQAFYGAKGSYVSHLSELYIMSL